MKRCKANLLRRQARNRFKLKQVSDRPRLSVYRSNLHIYVQLIDDEKQHTLAQACSKDKGFDTKLTGKAAAEAVGKAIAERAQKAGVDTVVFDRGGYEFHGRVAALASAAREAGLKF